MIKTHLVRYYYVTDIKTLGIYLRTCNFPQTEGKDTQVDEETKKNILWHLIR